MLHTLGSLEEVGGIGQPKNLLWMKGDISGVILEEAMFVTAKNVKDWVLGKHHSAHIAEEAEAAHAVDLSFSSSSSGPLLI